jgi:hypothetical protein
VAVILGIILQGALILADCKDTPTRAAVKFSKAFYRLDPDMAELLCKKYITGDKGNVVENYIHTVSKEAKDRGLGLNYMKSILYGVETHTRIIDDVTAEIKLTANRRTAINPIYALIGKFFRIGKTYQVDTLIPVTKEDGKWKVCGPLSLLSNA